MRSLTFMFFSFILMLSFSIKGQVQLSVYSEISIITADSGDNLYESFGHSALRLKDPILNLDLVYNYGVFDFDAPNFYSNFVKGRLLYKPIRLAPDFSAIRPESIESTQISTIIR